MTAKILSHRGGGLVPFKSGSLHPLVRPLRLALATFLVLLASVCIPKEARSTYLVFTMEVCQTCQADFQATWKGKDYGAPFLAQKLEQYGLKGTFFVSSLCPPSLNETGVSNMSFLASRGHDLELHPHPDVVDPSRPRLTSVLVGRAKKNPGNRN